MKVRKKNVVTIGGGSGQFTLLNSLRLIPNINITAVVSMADSGGSTGILRDQYGVLPPGDVLKCLIALSPYEDARAILQTRFSKHSLLHNHNAGNFLLTFLSNHTGGDFPAAIEAIGEILKIQGRVIPVTIDKVTLVAELTNGEHIYGEQAIDTRRKNGYIGIKRVTLIPHHGSIAVYPPAVEALKEADYIIVGPGDLFTSIIPNFLVKEVSRAVEKNSKARYIYIMNLLTKYGETHDFTPSDFFKTISYYIKRKFDTVLINGKKPSLELQEKYKKERARFLLSEKNSPKFYAVHNLLSEIGGIARHDVKALADALKLLLH